MYLRLCARVVTVVGALAVVASTGANVVQPQLPPLSPLPSLTWVPMGGINAVEQQGDVLYIGGGFDYIGPPNTQFGAVVSAQSGEGSLGLPRIEGGEVRVVVSDDAGGWFIGGAFTQVGGSTCNGVAHIRADLTVDPAFCGTLDIGSGSPQVAAVNALALSSTRLYVGGRFARIRFVDRSNLAALNRGSGMVESFVTGRMAWRETIPGIQGCERACVPEVHALAVGSSLYAAGNFTAIGTSERWGLAALDPATGTVRGSWDPKLSGFSLGDDTLAAGDDYEFQVPVRALALSGARLYAGGDFVHVDGGAQMTAPHHDGIVALDSGTGAVVTAFAAQVPLGLGDSRVKTLAVTGSDVFVGGHFPGVRSGSQAPVPRTNIAAFTTSGQVLPWKPDADDDVNALFATPDAVFVGGKFSAIGGKERQQVASIVSPAILTTGKATGWAPSARRDSLSSPNVVVNAVAASGASAFVGGNFDAIGGHPRTSLAAIDLTTGKPTSWAPQLSRADGGIGGVSVLARVGQTLYVGGNFDKIGDATRSGLGAISTDTATVLPWQPSTVPGSLTAMAATSTAVYVGGERITAGSQIAYAIALDPATGGTLPWAPAFEGIYVNSGPHAVFDILATGSTVYLAGNFATVAGQPRRGLAAVGALTGAPTAFNAAVNGGTGPPRSLALRPVAPSGLRLYVAGRFNEVGGQPRAGAAAVDAASGALTDWAPSFDRPTSILLSGPDAVLAGSISGLIKDFSIDPPGTALPFTASAPQFTLNTLGVTGDASLVAAGSFTSIAGRDQRGFAVFARADPVSVGESSAVVAKLDRWSAPVTCPATAARACSIDAVLRETATRQRHLIGRTHLALRARKTDRAVFLLTPKGLELLRDRRRLPAVVEAVSTDARGRVTIGTRQFILTFPRGTP